MESRNPTNNPQPIRIKIEETEEEEVEYSQEQQIRHLQGILAEQDRQFRRHYYRERRLLERAEEERGQYIAIQREQVRTHHQLKRVRPSPRYLEAWHCQNPQEAPVHNSIIPLDV